MKKFSCQICKERFVDTEGWEKHRKDSCKIKLTNDLFDNLKKFSCQLCKERFVDTEEWEKHRREPCIKKLKNVPFDKLKLHENFQILCNYCEQSFENPTEAEIHCKKSHPSMKELCTISFENIKGIYDRLLV